MTQCHFRPELTSLTAANPCLASATIRVLCSLTLTSCQEDSDLYKEKFTAGTDLITTVSIGLLRVWTMMCRTCWSREPQSTTCGGVSAKDAAKRWMNTFHPSSLHRDLTGPGPILRANECLTGRKSSCAGP